MFKHARTIRVKNLISDSWLCADGTSLLLLNSYFWSDGGKRKDKKIIAYMLMMKPFKDSFALLRVNYAQSELKGMQLIRGSLNLSRKQEDKTI